MYICMYIQLRSPNEAKQNGENTQQREKGRDLTQTFDNFKPYTNRKF